MASRSRPHKAHETFDRRALVLKCRDRRALIARVRSGHVGDQDGEGLGIHVAEHRSRPVGRGTADSPPMPHLNNSPRPRPKRRRRPWLFALCAALVAAGALGSAFAFTSVTDTQAVLVVSRDINRGETIEAGDLSVVRVGVDPTLNPVPGSQMAKLEGSRAAADLWAGTLLTEAAVTDQLVPGQGESLVGISLTPAQMPSEPLRAGDTVRIVTTPGDQGEVTNEDPVTVERSWLG